MIEEIKEYWLPIDLPTIEKLWDKLLPEFGSFKKLYKEEDLLTLYVYGGRMTYKISPFMDKVEELFPAEYKEKSIAEIIENHYGADAVRLLHSLNCEKTPKYGTNKQNTFKRGSRTK